MSSLIRSSLIGSTLFIFPNYAFSGASLVSEDSKGRQCAHLAAMRNKKKILQLLFDQGVDLDCRCEAGKTPIHYAAQYGGMLIYFCMESCDFSVWHVAFSIFFLYFSV